MVDVSAIDDPAAERALQALAGLAPDDPFWEDVEPFVGRVRQLAAEKLAVREQKQREEELRRALQQLRETGAPTLAFHEASDVLDWSAANFPPDAWPAVTALAVELRERLTHYSALQTVQPSNRTAEKERRARLDAIEEEIVERLETLRGLIVAPKPPEFIPPTSGANQPGLPDETVGDDDVHAALDTAGDQYSVFTRREEQQLTAPRPGACLVFASTATGLDSVEASMAGIARRRATLIEVPRAVQPAAFGAWLKDHVPADDRGRTIAWQRLGRWSTELGSGLSQLLDAQEAGGFRTVLVAGPVEARAFLSMGHQIASRFDAIVPCGRWQLSAIEQRIRDTRLDAGSGGAADVMSATRGWPRLLDVLWMRKAASTSLASMIAAFTSTFRSPGGYSGFWAALGVSAFPEAEIVFTLMARSHYSPRPAAAVPRWIIDRGAGMTEEVIVRAIHFLTMFQLLEVDNEGNIALDPVARQVVTSEF